MNEILCRAKRKRIAALVTMALCVSCTCASMADEQREVTVEYEVHHFKQSPFGFHVVASRKEGDTDPLAAFMESGAQWPRGGLWRSSTEREKGVYNWEATDRQFRLTDALNLQTCPMILSLVPWESTEAQRARRRESLISGHPMGAMAGADIPQDMASYRNWLRTAIERYDGDGVDDMPGLKKAYHYWQMENEWDGAWVGTPEDLLELFRVESETIRAADPDATIVLGGMLGIQPLAFVDGYIDQPYYLSKKPRDKVRIAIQGDSPFLPGQLVERSKLQAENERIMKRGGTVAIADSLPAQWEGQTREQIARNTWVQKFRTLNKLVLQRGGDLFDMASFHQYGRYEIIPACVQWIRDTMAEAGSSRPIVTSELGGPYLDYGEAYTERAHADAVVKYHAVALGCGLQLIYWSTLYPLPEWGLSQVKTSLIDTEGRKLPAFYTYKLLVEKLDGLRTAVRIPVEEWDTGTRIYKFETASGIVYIMWSERINGRHMEFPVKAASVLQTDVSGNEITLSVKDGRVTLDLTSSPVFIEPNSGNTM